MKFLAFLLSCFYYLFLFAAHMHALTPPVGAKDINWDEREELDLTKTIVPVVKPTVETAPVPRTTNEDAADDPAIWVHSTNPEESKIIGTDKRGGLAVYDLNGNEIQYLNIGSVNNVDLRYGFNLNNELIDIAAASNRTTRCIDLFKIDPKTGLLSIITSIPVSNQIDDIYGLCMGFNPQSSAFYVWANGKNGEIEQYQLEAEISSITAKLVKRMQTPSQPEGMVCDDLNGILFVGEEEQGIWKFNSWDLDSSGGNLIASTCATNNPNLAIDIEGITIYYRNEKEGYLIASSQGNHSYAVFDRDGENRYLGSFSIVDNDSVDGAEETDGIDVINLSLGDQFDRGLFVVQDGYNFDEEGKPASQNFKLVDWAEIAGTLELSNNPKFDSWLNR